MEQKQYIFKSVCRNKSIVNTIKIVQFPINSIIFTHAIKTAITIPTTADTIVLPRVAKKKA